MERTVRLLAVLLGVQVLIVIGVGLAGREPAAGGNESALLAFAKDSVDRLTITGADGAQVVLTRTGDGWQVPVSTGSFPADRVKVGEVLTRLAGLRRGLPVATTAGARERFKVADGTFERRITVAAAGKDLATLYVGTSPAMRQVHARTQGDDAIYLVDFAAYEAPARAADWQDKGLLRIPLQEIESIEVSGLRLTRAPAVPAAAAGTEPPAEAAPAWQADGLAAGETLEADAADRLARLVADLRIGEVLGTQDDPAFGLAKPLVELEIGRKGGAPVDYRLGQEPGKESYVLKSSARPEYFRIESFTAGPLIEAAAPKALVAGPQATP